MEEKDMNVTPEEITEVTPEETTEDVLEETVEEVAEETVEETAEEAQEAVPEEKKPKFAKPMIIAVCVLVVFAVLYFGIEHFANNRPAEIPSTSESAPVSGTVVPTPADPANPADASNPANTSKPADTTAPADTSKPANATTAPTETSAPEQKNLTFAEAMDLCQKTATKHLGEGTIVLPDFEGSLIEVTYDGKTRPCYVFLGGPVEYFMESDSSEPPARYCVDVTTGDIFDAISNKYIR